MVTSVNGKADVWRQRIEAQRASGQSIRAWCTANGTHEHSFYFWRKRLAGITECKTALAKAKPQAVESGRSAMAFARAVVGPAVFEPLRLRLPGERELILPASMPVEQVARLVHAIEMTA